MLLTAAAALGSDVPVVFLEDYDLGLARDLVAGADLWLNTPRPPLEASGTSGMKAAHNAISILSILDGWWHEGHVAGVTGWAFGGASGDDGSDARSLYSVLETAVAPAFYARPDEWLTVMRGAVALNASFLTRTGSCSSTCCAPISAEGCKASRAQGTETENPRWATVRVGEAYGWACARYWTIR